MMEMTMVMMVVGVMVAVGVMVVVVQGLARCFVSI